jgi:peptidyl-dipeptidase Dcp
VEFLASAFVDKEFHLLKPEQATAIDAAEFERVTLQRIGMLDDIAMRHRSPHFAHVFAGGYSAGYYSYMWSEVLDADGFDAFKETGDIFNPEVARRLRENVFAAGNRQSPMAAYVAFRGREPAVEPLLRNRGFLADSAAVKPQPGAG